MKCAAVFIFVSVALASQTFAFLRPLFPVNPEPPFRGEAIAIGDDLFRYLPERTPVTAPNYFEARSFARRQRVLKLPAAVAAAMSSNAAEPHRLSQHYRAGGGNRTRGTTRARDTSGVLLDSPSGC